MFPLWGLIIGLVVGLIRRGNLVRIAEIPLKAIWLVFAGLFVQLLIFPTPWSQPPIQVYVEAFHFFSYALIAAFFVLNWRVWELWAMAAGMGLNAIVITINRGFMPSSADALAAAGRVAAAEALRTPPYIHANTVLMSDQTQLNFFGDWMFVPSWVPLANAFSIGDLTLMFGLAWLIQAAMCRKTDSSV